jgi:transcriptional regulator with GAF, ATPase, and Fis domain
MAVPLRVLFVEDNPDDARVLQFELEASGYAPTGERVESVPQLRSALSRTPLPDIILADFTMPQLSALGVLGTVAEMKLDVPVVVVTGTVGEDQAVECMRQGAADYLLKDRLTRLGQAVKRAIEEKLARDFKKTAEYALHERAEFDTLLASLSTSLIRPSLQDMDAAIGDVLRAVGEYQGFERAAITRFDPATNRFALVSEWHVPGVPDAAIHERLGLRDLEWAAPELLNGKGVLAIRDELPASASGLIEAMRQNRTERCCFAPFRLRGHSGMLTFCWGMRNATVPPDIVRRITLIAEMIASTLARKRAEEERQAAYDELERLKRAAEQERDYLREELRDNTQPHRIVCQSPALARTLSMVDAVASTRSTVLLRGESGVGKEVVAYAIHERSNRAAGPLVKVNCASIPKELFESEFFGHVKGSFTGAHRNRTGRFELADGGTLFLDEVGEIPADMQSKLLRVLQENEFERIGDERTRKVDVRVVAATNRDLEHEVKAGRFRGDLFYRLNVFPIDVPPLRERKEDIVPLAEHFLRRFTAEMGRSGLVIGDAQRTVLEAHPWPGNVRELQHAIQRAVILSPAPPLRLDLGDMTRLEPASDDIRLDPSALLTDAELRDLERRNLITALERTAYRVAGVGGAAELLGVNPSTLRDRMKTLGIQRPES